MIWTTHIGDLKHITKWLTNPHQILRTQDGIHTLNANINEHVIKS